MKVNWKKIVKVVITILSALLTAAGGAAAMESCL